MTVRDVYVKEWEGLAKEAVEQGLEVLYEYKWARLEQRVGSKGGRPSKVIRLHPDLRGFAKGGKR